MRRGIQIASFLLFVVLFLLAAYPLIPWLPVDLFFRIDPLIAATAMLASQTIIVGMLWSLLLIAFSLVMGRAFCGYICPMGAIIDFFDHFVWSRKMKRSKRRIPRTTPEWLNEEALKKLKYYVLAFVLVSALFGAMTIHFFDPLSIVTRVFAFILYPASIVAVNAGLDAVRPLAETLNMFELARTSFLQPSYYMAFVTLLFFGGILALGALQPRFWCRNVCPLGAMLGLLGRFGLVKKTVSTACLDCGKCMRECPAGAISPDSWETAIQECLHCRLCEQNCPQHGVSFSFGIKTQDKQEEKAATSPELGLTRRGFVTSAGAGVATGFLLSVTPDRELLAGNLIRPPGAVPEELFLDRCIRCGECMKACMTNTLQPSLLEAGWEGLWTPRVDLRYAPCEQRCNVCGNVCPTEAIRPLDLEERKHAKMGTAELKHDRCLVWEQDKLCLICDEQCPYDAIEFRVVDGMRRPFVLENRCNGCGVCENKCPVQGEAAIIVTPIAALRLEEGSYIETSNRLGYEFSDAREDSEEYFLEHEAPADTSETDQPSDLPPGFEVEEEPETDLPPGFINN